ncbi:MAG: septal ring lytic transglycosylase RlpA family protein [Betaproteobacteria bacterium]
MGLIVVAVAASQLLFAQTPAPSQSPATAPPAGTPAATPASAATPTPAAAQTPPPAAKAQDETGLAAVYSDKLNGRKTASGQVYDRNQLTAAHKTIPFGTQVKVTNTKNDKSVVVRINDRGPAQAGRVLDLSPKAAAALGIKPTAMGEVRLEVVAEAPAKTPKK